LNIGPSGRLVMELKRRLSYFSITLGRMY
jgi:hypothetical protein